ncbi:hypothetical protein HPP92_014115 [Vanilla planifolia]|uniref:Uncharacterized protein n=1 Tax=Vanilla planifolia TaxID=51239 RepID=A0A835USU1_VANPL|nr:hypothetical protein HPP92_014115 [Vanilla planifolia]
MTSAADPTSSPRSIRATRIISSPWSHVVRGEHDPSSGGGGGTVPLSPSASPISSPELTVRSPRKPSTDSQALLFSLVSDHRGSDNAIDGPSVYRGKKPVWNVPSNGSSESGSVMDTLSWPALSESTRSSPKSASSESLKAHSDGPVSTAQGSVISTSTLKSLSNQNPNITQNTMPSTRHKSMKRVNSFGSSNGALPMSSSLPDTAEASQVVVGKQPPSEPSPRALANKNNGNNNSNNWDHGNKTGVFSPQSHVGNEHQRGHGSGSGRRGSNGHNNYSNRERGGYEWSHRNFGRDVHMQQPLSSEVFDHTQGLHL